MFKKLVPLSSEIHKTLKFHANMPYFFASEESLIPLTVAELPKISRDMLIVFPLRAGLPLALAGVEPKHNLHIQDDGMWIGRYVPAHLRRYPFILAEKDTTPNPEHGRQFALMIDESAPHFKTEQGMPLFNKDGSASDFLTRTQKLLLALQADQEKTLKLVAQLEEYNLLEPRDIRVNRDKDLEPLLLKGFRMIDSQRFSELDSVALAQLRDSGALEMIYAHVVSLTNLDDGWVAQQAKAKAKPKQTDTLLYTEADALFKFS